MRVRKRGDENRPQNVYLCLYINYVSPRHPIGRRAASASETPGPAGSSVLRANTSLARVAAFAYPFFCPRELPPTRARAIRRRRNGRRTHTRARDRPAAGVHRHRRHHHPIRCSSIHRPPPRDGGRTRAALYPGIRVRIYLNTRGGVKNNNKIIDAKHITAAFVVCM